MGYNWDKYGPGKQATAAPVPESASPSGPMSSASAPRVGFTQVLQEAPQAAVSVGRGILDFFTKNTQNLVNTAGKTIGEAIAYHTDPNVRRQVEGGNLPALIAQQSELIRRLKDTPEDDPAHDRLRAVLLGLTEDIKREGGNFKDILAEAGSVSSTGEGLKKIGGQALGSAAELASFAKGAQLARGAQKLGIGKTALAGAKSGGLYGALFGTSGALQKNKSLGDIAKSGLIGAGTGAATGAALSALLGVVAQRMNKKSPIALAEDTGTYVGDVPAPAAIPGRQIEPPLQAGAPPAGASPRSQGVPSSEVPTAQQSVSYTEPLARGPETVKGVADRLKGVQPAERGFITHVKESASTPEQLKAVVAGTYVPKAKGELTKAARDLIFQDPALAEQLAINPTSDVHVQVGNELLNHYATTGQTQKAAALTQSMAESGTEFGRAVQAFSNYAKDTPGGALKFAQSNVNSYNKIHPDKPLSITDTQVQSLFTRAEKVQKMAEGRERNIATNDLMEEIHNLIPSSVGDKAITVWKAGLLTSLRTHERNVLGNAIHGAAEIVKDPFAVANDIMLGAKTGERTTTFSLQSGEYGKKGVQAAKDIMTRGYDPERTLEKFDVRHVTWDNTPVQQALKKGTDFVYRSLSASDKIPYNYALGRSLYDQAGAAAINAGRQGDAAFVESLVKAPTDQMMKTAVGDAQRSVFQNDNVLRELASAAKRSLNKNEATKFISEFVAPFTGVPSSIAGEIAAYSPIGLTQGLVNDVKVLFGNSTNPALQRAASQQVGRGLVGTGILAAGAALAKKGLLTGEPKDQKERDQWELEGKQANSVLIGGKWRSINSVGPEAIIALAGGELGRQGTDKASSAEKLLNTAAYLSKVFTNQTFLAGVQQPLNVLTDPVRYKPSRYVGSSLGSFVPNILKDLGKSFDPLQREANSVSETVQSGLPGLRNLLPPRRNVLGQTLPNETTGLAPFIDIFNSKAPVKNPLVNELTRLYIAGLSATPSKMGNKQSLAGKQVTLTPKQLNALESESGGQVTAILNRLLATPIYALSSDEQKQKLIDSAVSKIRTLVKTKQLVPILTNPTP